MSLSLDKLKALRRQAGAVDSAPAAGAGAALTSAPMAQPITAAVAPTPVPSALTGTGARQPVQAALRNPSRPGPVATALGARAASPSPLEQSNRSGGHTDPVALAARAHAPDTPPRSSMHGDSRPLPECPVLSHPPATRPGLPTASPPAGLPVARSALDWINTSIRHADRAALAARAHGQRTTLRPSVRSGHSPRPGSAGASVTPVATVAAGLPATPTPPGEPTARSALDWINTAIRHADPATLAGHVGAPPGTVTAPAPAPASAAASKPASPPVQASAAVITPRSVGELQRLLGTRQRVQAAAPVTAHRDPARRDLPGSEIAPGLWLSQAHLPIAIPDAPLPLAFARRPQARVDARQLLFFDTETTGLAGGTGTRAFMIGAADWHNDPAHGPGLRVRQLLISTLGAEAAMLDTFAGWLGEQTVLSSFNGRSYDAPLLKTRYRLARRREPLSALDHIDLLHPCRRYWRGRWENCRLGTIERNVLGIEREDDLPGSQAPGAWLGYLRGGSSALLHRVAAHNHQDVVTLALLFARLVEEDHLGATAQPPPAAAEDN